MQGKHGLDGTVTITFNSQGEALEAPGGGKYLPCDCCGQVKVVAHNVVSVTCVECIERINRLCRRDGV